MAVLGVFTFVAVFVAYVLIRVVLVRRQRSFAPEMRAPMPPSPPTTPRPTAPRGGPYGPYDGAGVPASARPAPPSLSAGNVVDPESEDYRTVRGSADCICV